MARRYFKPCCHRMPPYAAAAAAEACGSALPVCERLCDVTLVLPTGMHVYREDGSVVRDVCATMRSIVEETLLKNNS